MTAVQAVDARREKLGAAAALELLRDVSRVVVAKGRKVVEFDLRRDPPDEQTLLKHLLGPTGNLRAPAIRRGDTLLVGFDQDSYRRHL